MPANLENSAEATGLEKVSFHSSPKECSNYCTIVLISHTSKIILKILQARFQEHVNRDLADVQGGFRKDRGAKAQITNVHWIIEKARELQKTFTSSLTTLEPLTVWITTNCGKFFKRWEYKTALPASWEICKQVKKQQFEPNMVPNLERNTSRLYIVTLLI